ncbi:hypothetical protein C9I57_30925 [Trinickia symbiotica]|uniref:Porin n=1 Tax=Trinickia symbiotica TaxID=863227 RepID=A0A2T3XKE3_9BURK|nr:hypothetical protein [Trinickia symbiotica]PTB16889.1 hypothetical protein C9I57_30925 [Trinickia symbiotica]
MRRKRPAIRSHGITRAAKLTLETAALMLTLWAAAPGAYAGESPSMFALSGFGTLGVAHSSLDTADFTGAAFQPAGAGYTRRFNVAGDTKFGLQLTGRFTDKLTALVQVVSRYNYDNSYTPTIEWANVNYAFTPDLNVRVGRIELPTFLSSDYREVGYANPWVRVPGELYNLEPITNSDGVDASYKLHFAHVIDTLHLIYGRTSFHITPGGTKFKGTDIGGVVDTLEYRSLTLHFGYLHAYTSSPFAQRSAAAAYSVGIGYDVPRWFVQGELARVTADGMTPGYLAGYLSGGMRFGQFTPYATYAVEHALNYQTIIPNANLGQKDLSVGLRWDFAKNLDMKVQYEHIWTPSQSAGLFINEQPNFRNGCAANVFSATLDFVF